MTDAKDVEIKLLGVNLIAGWNLNISDQICKLCDGLLTLPPKNMALIDNKIISNDKVIVGKCDHSYHKSCLEEFGDCCFEDNLIFKKKQVISTNLSDLI